MDYVPERVSTSRSRFRFAARTRRAARGGCVVSLGGRRRPKLAPGRRHGSRPERPARRVIVFLAPVSVSTEADGPPETRARPHGYGARRARQGGRVAGRWRRRTSVRVGASRPALCDRGDGCGHGLSVLAQGIEEARAGRQARALPQVRDERRRNETAAGRRRENQRGESSASETTKRAGASTRKRRDESDERRRFLLGEASMWAFVGRVWVPGRSPPGEGRSTSARASSSRGGGPRIDSPGLSRASFGRVQRTTVLLHASSHGRRMKR